MSEKVIFYIAVAAIWGLYNLYTKAQKGKAQPKQVAKSTPAAKPVDVEAMLEELLNPGKKNAETPKPEEAKPAYAEFTGNEDAQKSADAAYDFDATKYYDELKKIENEEVAENNRSLETQMVYDNEQSLAPVTPVVEERTESVDVNEWLVADADDIRRAIIWNEILKRPAWAN